MFCCAICFVRFIPSQLPVYYFPRKMLVLKRNEICGSPYFEQIGTLLLVMRRCSAQTILAQGRVSQRCDLRPAATSAVNCFDCPRGTLSDCHLPVEVKVKCLAKNRICPIWCE